MIFQYHISCIALNLCMCEWQSFSCSHRLCFYWKHTVKNHYCNSFWMSKPCSHCISSCLFWFVYSACCKELDSEKRFLKGWLWVLYMCMCQAIRVSSDISNESQIICIMAIIVFHSQELILIFSFHAITACPLCFYSSFPFKADPETVLCWVIIYSYLLTYELHAILSF